MISVIVPIYKCEDYIEKCLESISSQDYRDIEIVCVNDGSPDNSLRILENYQKKEPRLQIVTQQNGGRSCARNSGLKYAKGEFIMFVDGDDELLPGAISTFAKALYEHPNVDAAVGSIQVEYQAFHHYKEQDTSYYTVRHNGILDLNPKLIDDFHCSSSAVMFRSSLIKNYQLQYPLGLNYEDAYWHWCYFSVAKKVFFTPQAVYKYYRRPGSIMSTTFKGNTLVALDHLRVMERLIDFWHREGLEEKLSDTIIHLLEQFFWLSYRYVPKNARVLAISQCWQLMEKYQINVEKNSTLNKIKAGDLSFLYNQQVDQSYIYFLKLKTVFDRFFPQNTKKRRWIITLIRRIYHLMK